MTAGATPQPFDLHTVAFGGLQVIEASAGTGKTRTITGLFVRLVLEQAIRVEDILVVTYTVAATEELRRRIRALLQAVLRGLEGRECGDPFGGELVARVVDRAPAAWLARRALADFDLAAIHTIHGFCQRALADTAFDGGLPFDTDLLADAGELVQDVVDDFWRRRVTTASPLLVQRLLDAKLTPDALASGVARHLARPDLRLVPPSVEAEDEARELECRRRWDALRGDWPGARAAVDALLRDPGLKQNVYRPAAVTTLLRRMDAAVRDELPRLEGRDADWLRRLGAAKVAGAWRKGAVARSHPILEAVEGFVEARASAQQALVRRLRALKAALLDETRRGVAARKRLARVRSFDDLLIDLQRVLEGPDGEALAGRLRARWRAALVDEFQDTDPAQYDIVRRIWGRAEHPVFVVGDPKQAIYRFRGADVFAYLMARDQAVARHQLTDNWRSEPGLITAVNALFGRPAEPFVLDDIPFPPARAARAGCGLEADGEPAEPLRIWFLARDDDRKVMPKSVAAHRVAEATAAEIARLLRRAGEGRIHLPAATGGRRRLEGRDVAVLVRSHRQGRLVAAALARRHVPSVQQAEDSVFASREADELRRVLLAVAEPGRDALVRAALGTELLGVSGQALAALADDEPAWTAWLDTFQRYHQRWRDHGVGHLFRTLLAEQDIAPRLLAYADGERRLTNLLHLGELLQAEASRLPRGLEALVQWMAERAEDDRPEDEAQQLRLESDEDVVQIVTVHKSKGLEYPIVFCPFVWDGRLFASDIRAERDVVCHDPAAGDRATLELEADQGSPFRIQASREELAEQVRLFYVAVTRAVHRCVLAWGLTGDSHTAAPFWLLHAPPGATDGAALLQARDQMRDATVLRDLEALAARSDATIRIERLPPAAPVAPPPPARPLAALEARPVRRALDWSWTATSFSALAAGRDDERDHDAGVPPAAAEVGADAFGIHRFPRGARAGICLHAMLEQLDFAGGDAGARSALVADQLARFGFDAAWAPAVGDMLDRVLAAPLAPVSQLRLAAVPRGRRLDELDFTYPVERIDVDGLRAVLAAHGVDRGPFAASIAALSFRQVCGFMRGYIDLVFEADGRYWLADYKSNWLGPTADDYAADRLAAVMARDAYWLQYLIYIVALHRLLRLRLPGYAYETHVGGVFYLFLRGMDPARPGCGVFHDRPSAALVQALDAWFGGAS